MTSYKDIQSIFSTKHIWKVLLLFMIFCSAQKAEAQIRQLDNGIADTIKATCTNGTDLYVLAMKHTNWRVYNLYRWDGTNWTKLTNDLKFSFWDLEFTLTPYNNEIYINTAYDTLYGVKGRSSIFKWNGKQIESVNVNVNPSMYAGGKIIAEYNGRLYIIMVDKSFNRRHLFAYNGKTFEEIDSIVPNTSILYMYDNAHVWNDKLYIKTDIRKKIGTDSSTYTIAVWNDTVLNYLQGTEDMEVTNIGTHQDGLIVVKMGQFDYSSVLLWNENAWKDITANSHDFLSMNSMYLYDVEGFSKNIWLSGIFKGNNNEVLQIIVWNGKEWTPFPTDFDNNKVYPNFVKSSTSLYMYGDFKTNFNVTLNGIGQIGTLARLSGKLYVDTDNDCIADSNEIPVNHAFLHIQPIDYYINTNDSGNYSIYLDSGLYSLKAIPRKYFGQTCPINTDSTIINAYLDSIHINNFAISARYNVQDVRLTLTGSLGWRARKGFTENYTLCYENVGTTKASGKITLQLDSAFTDFSSSPSPKSYNNLFAEWEFDSLEIGEKRCITFKARLDSATLNDSVKIVSAFDGGDGWVDSSYHDNIDTLKQRVVAAVDPNDKTSYPEGDITKETKELRYQIRFQNTGTDTAYRVTIIDTVDTNLPLTKVMMNTASHKYKLDIKNNVFKWTFDGIMLPDSNINEPLSHGFINYTAQIKPGLAIGTEIKNTAYIYFDYQKPVITNTARSKMTEPVGIREQKSILGNTLNIYPNPASNKIYLNNTGNTKKQVIIFNSMGQQVQTLILQAQEVMEWKTDYLPNGIFFILAEGEQTHKLVIQH